MTTIVSLAGLHNLASNDGPSVHVHNVDNLGFNFDKVTLLSLWRLISASLLTAPICRFWWQYSNINRLVVDLGIDDPFTDWTCSSFWSPAGLEVSQWICSCDQGHT